MTKYLIIALVILLIITFIFFIFFRREAPSSPVVEPTASPEVVGPFDISLVLPGNSSTNVDLTSEISVTFNRPLKYDEQEQVVFSAVPSIEGSTRFSSDGTTLMISPSGDLRPNQNYILTVSWGDNSFEWSFITTGTVELTEAEQIERQKKADENYGKWAEEVDRNYPWLQKLPLKDPNYFVYFDIDKNSFYGVLYVEANDSRVSSLKSTIEQRLTSLDIPFRNYQFVWETD
jgi:hypothetical protein